MTKDKHTKGPWHCTDKKGKYLADKSAWSADYDGEFSSTTSIPILAGKTTVALAVSVDKHWHDQTATNNAHLIAAAPTQHEALLEAEKFITCYITQVMPKGGVLDAKTMLKVVQHALAEARGETSKTEAA